MSGQFVHLHVHTEKSINDGLSKVSELVDRAVELGMPAMAVTEHGNMFSAVDFYKACKKKGIKPIIGCEVYVCPTGKEDKVRDNRHLVLLCKNEIGYKNLVKITSDAWVNGKYYNPRTDYDFLSKHSEGLIALTACLGGDISREYFEVLEGAISPFKTLSQDQLQNIKEKAYKKCLDRLGIYIDIFGRDNLYLEVQDNGIKEQYEWNEVIYRLSEDTGLPVVCTNDCHYVYKEDFTAHDAVMALQTGAKLKDKNRRRYDTDQLYVKSYDELNQGRVPQSSLDITLEIADRCNFEFEFGHYHIPTFDQPEEFETSEDYLDYLIEEGMKKRYPNNYDDPELVDRVNYELSVIRRMGYNDYFLDTWDYVNFCKENGILVGPGRGSGAGSIICYAIGITDVDPIRFNLLFERFLNPDRASMPDIDIDFQKSTRDNVKIYLKEKYGLNRISSIITYQTNGAKNAIRNSGRVLDLPNPMIDEMAKSIPDGCSITDVLEMPGSPLEKMYREDLDCRKCVDLALKLEGNAFATGQHAAGVLISPARVDDYVPVMTAKDGSIVAAYPMGILEELGMLKADLLGLRNLDVIADTIRLIKQTKGIQLTNDDLLALVDDPNSYKLVAEGKTNGIFQIESRGMTEYAKQLKVRNIDELSALISLYRPGPMDSIPDYIHYKFHPEDIEVAFEPLREVLKETYGVLVYQEQVMAMSRVISGYTPAMSDYLRKAIGKKKMDMIAEHKQYFVYGKTEEDGKVSACGGVTNGFDEERLLDYYDNTIVPFGRYSFNKSHGVCYAFISAETAGLKYYYPAEYYAALLTSVSGIQASVDFYTKGANEMGVDVLPPSINYSGTDYSVDNKGNIRMGLATIKNVGAKATDKIIEERENYGKFTSLTDFVYRCLGTGVDTSCVEWLIRAGAFDELENNKAALLSQFSYICEEVQHKKKKEKDSCMSPLFADWLITKDIIPKLNKFPNEINLRIEREALGLYMSGHPLDDYRSTIEKKVNISTLDFIQEIDDEGNITKPYNVTHNQRVSIIGVVAEIRLKADRNNNMMAWYTLEDLHGTVSVTIFASLYETLEDISEGDIVYIFGRVSHDSDYPPNITAMRIKKVEQIKQKKVIVKIRDFHELDLFRDKILKRFEANCRGENPVFAETNHTRMLISERYWVNQQGIDALKNSGLEVGIVYE